MLWRFGSTHYSTYVGVTHYGYRFWGTFSLLELGEICYNEMHAKKNIDDLKRNEIETAFINSNSASLHVFRIFLGIYYVRDYFPGLYS